MTDKIREVAEWAGWEIQSWQEGDITCMSIFNLTEDGGMKDQMATNEGLTSAGCDDLIEKLRQQGYSTEECVWTSEKGWKPRRILITHSRSLAQFEFNSDTRPEAVLEAVSQCVEAMK